MSYDHLRECVCLMFQIMTDVVGNPEEERRADFYYLPWSQEAVCRYFYTKVTFYTVHPFAFDIQMKRSRLVTNSYEVLSRASAYRSVLFKLNMMRALSL